MGFWAVDADDIVSTLKGWKIPSNVASEKACERALGAFLHQRFPSDVFEPQYRLGNTSSALHTKKRLCSQ